MKKLLVQKVLIHDMRRRDAEALQGYTVMIQMDKGWWWKFVMLGGDLGDLVKPGIQKMLIARSKLSSELPSRTTEPCKLE